LGSGTSYSATFTPLANSEVLAAVNVASGVFSDAVGNFNDESFSFEFAVDTLPPTIAITSDLASLPPGDTATLTFTLSEESADFDVSDINVTGATLSEFSGSGIVYTALLTMDATPGNFADAVISVSNDAFHDAAGNPNVDGSDPDNSVTIALDTIPPRVSITSDKLSLAAGETAQLTFKLSARSTDFSESDVSVFKGTLSDFSGSGAIYTATFTPLPNSSNAAMISVTNNRFSNSLGLFNEDGFDADNSVKIAIDSTTTDPDFRVIPLNEQVERVAEFGAMTTHRLSGPDKAFFTITSGGTLLFRKVPDYERPYDEGNDNGYEVTVTSYKNGKVVGLDNLRVQVQESYIAQKSNAAAQFITGRPGYLQIFQDTPGNNRLTGGDCLDTFIITGGTDTITDFNYLGANKDWRGNVAPSGQEVLRVSQGGKVNVTVSAPWTATSESMNAGTINFSTAGKMMDLSEMSVLKGVKILNTAGAVTLTGSAMGDTIIGGTGKDSIFGGLGNDSLMGGLGNDLLSGDLGDDSLAGGAGMDSLSGGGGADWFILDTASGATNVDTISDFTPGEDKIVLSAKLFNKFKGSAAGSAITADNFVVGAGAKPLDKNDYLIWDTAAETLRYDPDGSGGAVASLIAKVTLTGVVGDPIDPSASDILIVL
jgi:Ca2+-binding RTX toxin-like protein